MGSISLDVNKGSDPLAEHGCVDLRDVAIYCDALLELADELKCRQYGIQPTIIGERRWVRAPSWGAS